MGYGKCFRQSSDHFFRARVTKFFGLMEFSYEIASHVWGYEWSIPRGSFHRVVFFVVPAYVLLTVAVGVEFPFCSLLLPRCLRRDYLDCHSSDLCQLRLTIS